MRFSSDWDQIGLNYRFQIRYRISTIKIQIQTKILILVSSKFEFQFGLDCYPCIRSMFKLCNVRVIVLGIRFKIT